MEADLQVKKSDELFAKLQSQHMEKLLLCLRRVYEIFSAVRGLEVLSKPIFFEATSAHPKFYVEEHVWPICKTPESVLVYANLCLRKQ